MVETSNGGTKTPDMFNMMEETCMQKPAALRARRALAAEAKRGAARWPRRPQKEDPRTPRTKNNTRKRPFTE